MLRPTPAVLPAIILSLACAPGELPPPPAPPSHVVTGRPPAPLTTPLASGPGRDSSWPAAANGAVAERRPGMLPLVEAFYLAPDQPSAVAWWFGLRAGQVLEIALRPARDAPSAVLEVLESNGSEYRVMAGGSRSLNSLELETPRTGDYVVLVRSEPGRGGGYLLSVRSPLALTFPVAGFDASAIRGAFGDDRAGGRRDHDGVDIFAPRGTPVVAAANAVVARVETDRTGGRVIWAQDEVRGLSYFYAHLQRQLVKRGARIAAGDTIGTVGNTGNAWQSSPHLHFGVYRPGTVPVDPAPFLAAASAESEPELPADSAVAGLGGWARTRTEAVRLRAAPDRQAPVLSQLEEGTVVQLVGTVHEWRRIRLADGTAGFVANWLLAPLTGSY